MFELQLSQSQTITFVMVDATNSEVTGLGALFTVEISKAAAAFAASTGAKAEVGSGWYKYTLTAAETDAVGPLSVKVTAPGSVQQNLAYHVKVRSINAVAFTYTVTDSLSLLPIEGVECWFATDSLGANVVWYGMTDTFGIAVDEDGDLPRLDPGTYFIFRNKAGYTFTDPDTEVVS